MLKNKQIIYYSIILFLSASCSPISGPDKSFGGAVLGSGWGAGAGAIIGNQLNDRGPGALVGAGLGLAAGALQGMGLDILEGEELDQQRELDGLKTQVASNEYSLVALQTALDNRDQKLIDSTTSLQVFFDKDLAALRLGSVKRLEHFTDLLKYSPYVGTIEVHGHSDDTGDVNKNMSLSEARAKTVAVYLVSNGVSVDQIKIIPHGAELPLASNQTDSGRQLNRRAEIVLLR